MKSNHDFVLIYSKDESEALTNGWTPQLQEFKEMLIMLYIREIILKISNTYIYISF